MVRGNWQRRVELTASARQAYKLQKESRRNKQHQRQHEHQQHRTLISAEEMQESYRGLEQWLDENGNAIVRRMMSSNDKNGSSITVDIWTDSIPTNRPEYAPPSNESFGDDTYYNNIRKYYNESINNSNDDHNTHSKGGGRNSINKKSKKGKSHPNTKNKSAASVLENNNTIEGCGGGSGSSGGRDRSSSISSQNGNNYEEPRNSKLCAREFFFGKEKCKGAQQFVVAGKKSGGGGGRKGRSSSVGAEDDTNNISNTIDGVGSGSGIVGCCWRHYHQLPKNKSRTVMPPALPTPTPPMTLAQVLNEKFHTPQLHNPRDCNDDDDGKIHDSKDSITTNIKPTVSLPVSFRDRTLKSSFEAASIIEEDGTSASTTAYIDMMYHTRFFVDNAAPSSVVNSDGDDDVEKGDASNSSNDDIDKSLPRSTIHESLQRILKEYNIPSLTSVVYLTIQGVLIFDRYRGGLVVTEKGERFLLYGEAITLDTTRSSLDESKKKKYYPSLDNNDEINDESMPIYERLTHTLLDEILAFSDDECVGILPRVCRSWYDEVGSPSLWTMLLDRHGWPMSVNDHGDSGGSGSGGESGSDDDARGDDYFLSGDDILHHCKKLRETFISHYSVSRDVRALSNACTYIVAGGGTTGVGSSNSSNHKPGLESAMHIFKTTKGTTSNNLVESQCHVKIWSENGIKNEDGSARSLVAYEDCTLRLFEVVRGNSDQSGANAIKCRQVACLRAAPHFISRKKDRCKLMGIDLDDAVVACLIRGRDHDKPWMDHDNQWMTVISCDDIVCAGNEGLLEDCVQSYDLQLLLLDYIYDELPPSLSEIFERDESVRVSVGKKLIACGRGNFLISAYVSAPLVVDGMDDDDEHINIGVDNEDIFAFWRNHLIRGHRLFLFSTRSGSIVKSLVLERERDNTTLFASRPFKHRSDTDGAEVLCTTVLISDPSISMPLSFIAVEIRRDGTIDFIHKAMIEEDKFAPWCTMSAALTSSHAVFSTNPIPGPALHVQAVLPSRHDEIYNNLNNGIHSFDIGEPYGSVRSMFIIREHYVAVVVKEGDENNDELGGEWFGLNEAPTNDDASVLIIVYHIPSSNEICRCTLPSAAVSIDSIGDTLAMNVSNLGFVITGEDARDVGRVSIPLTDMAQTMASPSIKQPKGKKKRLASLASGRKKDGFARGMSLRG